MRSRRSSFCFWIAALVLSTSTAFAGDWPGFRGPNGNGIADETNVPLTWSSTKNVKWRFPIGPGNGSPIVVQGKVLVLNAAGKGRQRSLVCLDRTNGKQLWTKTVEYAKQAPTHQTNPYCGSTPASNGKIVIVWHASSGLYAYDLTGKQIWKRNLGEFRHMWGYGTSPVIVGDRVILHSGPGKRIFVGAYKLSDGTTIWENDEPQDGNGERRKKDGNYMGSWATPVIATINGSKQVVCTLPTRVNGYDLDSGKILWWCNGISGERGDLAYSSPIIAGKLCVANGGYMGPAIGIPLGGSGDLTGSRLWRLSKTHQNIGSGVFVKGHIFKVNAGPNTLECIDPRTGKLTWAKPQRGKGGPHWGSLVYAAGKLFATGQNGTTMVYEADTSGLHVVATNKLNETCNSTAAFSNGEIFIRTYKHVYCIAK